MRSAEVPWLGVLNPDGFPSSLALERSEYKGRSSMKARIIFHGVAILILLATIAAA
jgi:hypothetical protein